jgi:hypothetical protein
MVSQGIQRPMDEMDTRRRSQRKSIKGSGKNKDIKKRPPMGLCLSGAFLTSDI